MAPATEFEGVGQSEELRQIPFLEMCQTDCKFRLSPVMKGNPTQRMAHG